MKLVIGGDICLTCAPRSDDAAKSVVWRRVREADAAIANLETTLTARDLPPTKAVTHSAPLEAAEVLAKLGFDVVSLANNHTMDLGSEGLADTIAALDSVGVQHCGAGGSIDAALRPATIEASGTRVAVIGASCAVPPASAATTTRAGIVPIRVQTSYECDPTVLEEQPGSVPRIHTELVERDVEQLSSAIARARATHDEVVVMLHWGAFPVWLAPIQGCVLEYQEALAPRLLMAGASLVVGCGSHQSGPQHLADEGSIAFALGDLIFQRFPTTVHAEIPSVLDDARAHALLRQATRSGQLLCAVVGDGRAHVVETVNLGFDADGEPFAVDAPIGHGSYDCLSCIGLAGGPGSHTREAGVAVR